MHEDSEDYWNWSFAELGTYDLPALVRHIKYTIDQPVSEPYIEHTDKIIYLGYDQGATQMLYGLSYLEDDFYSNFIRGAILLAPCAKMNVLGGTMGYNYYNELDGNIKMIGLHGLLGHNWEYFKPDVCAHLGRSWCEQHHVWRTEAISAKALQHYFQNGIEGRFQEFSDEYTHGKTRRITSDIPISTIDKVPLAVFYGDQDIVCPIDQTEWIMQRIGGMVYGNYQFGGYAHEDFGKANDSVFMNELHEALSHLHPHRHEQFHGRDFEMGKEHERMRREFDPDDDLGEFETTRDYSFLM